MCKCEICGMEAPLTEIGSVVRKDGGRKHVGECDSCAVVSMYMAAEIKVPRTVYVLNEGGVIYYKVKCEDLVEAKRQLVKLDTIINKNEYRVIIYEDLPTDGDEFEDNTDTDAEKWENYWRDNGRGL